MNIYLLIFQLLNTAYSARILVIMPSPNYSFALFGKAIYTALAKQGHDVVVFTHFPFNEDNNYQLEEHLTNTTITGYELMWNINLEKVIWQIGMAQFFTDHCHNVYKHEKMIKLLENPNEKFDLVMVEWGIAACFSILKEHFKAPLVGFRSLDLELAGHDAIGNPTNPSYIRTTLTFRFLRRWRRINDNFVNILIRVYYNFIIIPSAQRVVDHYFPGIVKDVRDLEKSADLILANTNYLLTGVRPRTPTMVEVDMIHIGQQSQVLGKGLQEYLDGAENGFILFNWGSVISINMLSQKQINMILQVLRILPYKIIWKTSEKLNFPENVKTFDWLPQESILAHPNIRCFITHAGLLSIQEAIYYEVPVVAIPIMFDQPYCTERIEELGIGLAIDYEELNNENLYNAVISVIEDNRFKKNVKQISKLMKYRPVKPMDKAMWWIEYVLRNNGTPFMRSECIDLDWITYLNLDILLLMVILIWVFFLCLQCIYSLAFGGRKDKKD